ncbi:hypothetical protein diail_11243 [Diaporthe ilicicola]|nr:hypothetical protein diail_11243 [Diaporthe ilicicola]
METRQQAIEGLRELGGDIVHVPPPTPVTPSKKRVRELDESETPSEGQLHKKLKHSPPRASVPQPNNESEAPMTVTAAENVSK